MTGPGQAAASQASPHRRPGAVEPLRSRPPDAPGPEESRWLLAAVAHDLGTPLTALRLLVEALADDLFAAAERDRQIAAMRVHLRGLELLLDDLFELTLIGSHDPSSPAAGERATPGVVGVGHQSMPVLDLLEESILSVEPQARRRQIAVVSSAARESIAAIRVHEQLRRVLTNLLDNALRHTPTGGRVGVQARPAGDEVEVSVANSGAEISAAAAWALSDSRSRAARPRPVGRAGLGLAICRAIVEAHGGRIWLADATEGTCVCLTAPIVARGDE